MHLLEVLLCAGPLVLQLYQHSPEPSFCEVGFEALFHDCFRILELAHPHEHHDGLKLDLPFGVGLSSHPLHDLQGPFVLSNHLEILCVLKERNGNLLQWYFHTGSLDAESGLIHVALILHESGGDQPNLPLDAVWTVRGHQCQVLLGLLFIS